MATAHSTTGSRAHAVLTFYVGVLAAVTATVGVIRTGGPAVAASAAGASGDPSALGKPMRVRSGGHMLRTRSGFLSCTSPPGSGPVGCAGPPGPPAPGPALLLKPSRRLDVFPGFIARGVQITVTSREDEKGRRRTFLDRAATYVPARGAWTVCLPRRLTGVRDASIFVDAGERNASYLLAVRAVHAAAQHCRVP